MIKNNKTKLVKKIVLPVLKEHGFEYVGHRGKDWEFVNETSEVDQVILISEYRHNESYFTFTFPGVGFLNSSMIDKSELFLGEYWKVETEEEFEKFLFMFLEIMQTQGFELSQKVSVVSDEQKIINRISKEVFENRNQIYSEMIKKNPSLNTTEYTKKTLREWFSYFKKNYSFIV